MEMTNQEYEKAIPAWCHYKTMQEHIDIMLCWGISLGRVQHEGENYCKGCEIYVDNSQKKEEQ